MPEETAPGHDANAFCAFARQSGFRTISHLQALLNLAYGESLTVSEIGKVLGDTEQNTNYILVQLAHLGLVTRGPGRPAKFTATALGRSQSRLILYGPIESEEAA